MSEQVAKGQAGERVRYVQRRLKKDGTVVESEQFYVRKGREEMKKKVAFRKNIKSKVMKLSLIQLEIISNQMDSLLSRDETESETESKMEETDSEDE